MYTEDWGIGKLDGLNYLLYGLGAFSQEGIIMLIWKNYEMSRDALGVECTKEYYLEKLSQNSPYSKIRFAKERKVLEEGHGQTFFDKTMEIIEDHKNIWVVEK